MLLQHGIDGATLSLLPSWETPRAETARKVTTLAPNCTSGPVVKPQLTCFDIRLGGCSTKPCSKQDTMSSNADRNTYRGFSMLHERLLVSWSHCC